MIKVSKNWTFIFIFIMLFPFLAESRDNIIISPTGELYYAYASSDFKSITVNYKYTTAASAIMKEYNLPDTNCQVGGFFFNRQATKLAIQESCLSPSSYRLLVLDLANKSRIASLIDASGPSYFSPDGGAIVFLSDYPNRYGAGLGEPPAGYESGVWIYNFRSRTKTKIDVGKMRDYDPVWSMHDGNIYFDDFSKVVRYNVSKRQVQAVPYKGIYFSPDGKYYTDTPNEGYSKIYRTSDNKEMIGWRNAILKATGQSPVPESDVYSLYFQTWSNKLNMAIFNCGTAQNPKLNVVFDPKIGKVVGKFNGLVIGTNPDGTFVAIHPLRTDNPRGIDHNKIEVINLLDIIKK